MENTICEPMCGHCLTGYHMQKQSWDTNDSFIEEAKRLCYNTPGCGKFCVESRNYRTDAYLCNPSSAVRRSFGNVYTTYIMGK